MRTDVSGWVTRLTDEAIDRYTRSGAWRGVTLADCALREAARGPDRIAVVEGERSITYGQVVTEARRLVGAFDALRLVPGDVISFQLPNWVEAGITFWAASYLGAVVVPIVHFYGSKEVGFILEQSGAEVLVTADRFGHLDYLANLEALRPRLHALREVFVVGERVSAGTRPFSTLATARVPSSNQTCPGATSILCSSVKRRALASIHASPWSGARSTTCARPDGLFGGSRRSTSRI